MTYIQDFNKEMHQIMSHGHNSWDVFRHFCRMSAITLAQPLYKSEKLELEYLNLAKNFSKEDMQSMCRMLGITILALEDSHRDFLGEVYMSNNMGNNHSGQFFTPYNVSKMIAQIIGVSGKVHEPCCGSGGMIIAAHEINPKLEYAICCDIDPLCCDMCYIQLSILGIPAIVYNGDTLKMEYGQS